MMKCAVLLRVFSLPNQSKAFRKGTVFFLLPPFSTGCAKMVGFPYVHTSRAFVKRTVPTRLDRRSPAGSNAFDGPLLGWPRSPRRSSDQWTHAENTECFKRPELPVPPLGLILFLIASFCRRDQSLSCYREPQDDWSGRWESNPGALRVCNDSRRTIRDLHVATL